MALFTGTIFGRLGLLFFYIFDEDKINKQCSLIVKSAINILEIKLTIFTIKTQLQAICLVLKML